MTGTEVALLFEFHLDEMERGLYNLKYQLGVEWDDVKQMAMIRLLGHNERHGIDEANAKNLYFVTLRNMAINAVKKNQRKTTLINSNYDTTDCNIPYDDIEYTEVVDNIYKDKLIATVGIDRYNELVEGYSVEKVSKSSAAQLWRAKYALGYRYEFVLTWEGNKEIFKHKQEVEEYLKMSNLSLKTKHGGFFTHRKVNYRLDRVAVLKDNKKTNEG